ncbi:hypothetical protein GCM10027447_32030 [Glycomyces halotolerans]
MSPDTTAMRPDSEAAERPDRTRAPEPERPAGPGRLWTYLTFGAAAAFAGALILVAAGLFADVTEVSDTPERTVEEFLTALLEDRDAASAADWLCEEKADRDLTAATGALAEANAQVGLEWSAVTETSRSVGGATVTAELTTTGGDTAIWTFTLVAEDSDPQWLVCDIDSH